MEARLIKRGLSSGRSDDNVETIAKRFRTFVKVSQMLTLTRTVSASAHSYRSDAAHPTVMHVPIHDRWRSPHCHILTHASYPIGRIRCLWSMHSKLAIACDALVASRVIDE